MSSIIIFQIHGYILCTCSKYAYTLAPLPLFLPLPPPPGPTYIPTFDLFRDTDRTGMVRGMLAGIHGGGASSASPCCVNLFLYCRGKRGLGKSGD